MIEAQHQKWARFVFNPYIKRLLRNNFSHFYCVNEPPEIPHDVPLIITPNHISWWDGFFIDYYFQKFSTRKIYLMMLEEQLAQFRFFRRLGAFSIEPGNPRSIIESFGYSKVLLANPENYLVMYPQGEIEAFEKRLLRIKEGLRQLLKHLNNDAFILPVGFKIHYYNEKYPVVIARPARLIHSKEILANFDIYKSEFHRNLDELSDAAISKDFIIDLFDKKKM
ncbi:MAG: lysophospholipid acyltransferase family protein [bacterium]